MIDHIFKTAEEVHRKTILEQKLRRWPSDRCNSTDEEKDTQTVKTG